MAEIIITATKAGEVNVKAEGYQGPSCAMVTAPYIAALGLRRDEQVLPEMFGTETQTQQVSQ